ncbi:MAG: hypothetical protein IJ996_02900 [Clostridia bacterium]|nr:hypothetical protein [Clostridia bacterium]
MQRRFFALLDGQVRTENKCPFCHTTKNDEKILSKRVVCGSDTRMQAPYDERGQNNRKTDENRAPKNGAR